MLAAGMGRVNQPRQILACWLLLVSVLIGASACSSEFDKCVEAKQDQYKREHPDDNWENLVRAREQFQQECQSPNR